MAQRQKSIWDKVSQKDLYRWALIVFVMLVLPVWFFRANKAVKDSGSSSQAQSPRLSEISLESTSVGVEVYDSKTGHVLNMDLEEYIVCVVAAEMPASYEMEALKAQAVAARTYTVNKMPRFHGGGCNRGADICTDSAHCQAFRSVDERRKSWAEDFESKEAKIRSAVMETAGQIVTYDDQPIEAFFHSTAGGMTEDSANAFSQALPYLKSVISNESDAPRYESRVEISRSDFVNKVNKAYPKAKLKESSLEKNVIVIDRFESGRIDRLQIGKTEISGKELRKLFSLDSTNVSFEFAKNFVTMHTKGFGHGVGMSQSGANNLAKSGASYAEILSYYYQGTQIESLDMFSR